MNVKQYCGAIHFVTFVDNYSRYGHMYLVSHDYETLNIFKLFATELETHLEQRVKTLQTDRGREYLSNLFKEFCEKKGIRRQLTISGTPQRNGVAERMNCTLLDMVRSMMAHANLPISF